MAIDGAVTGDRFVAYARQVLAPALRPGDVVVMDDVVCHKRAEVRAAIAAAGATRVFLPPDSPDLNPSERAFGELKALLRKAGKRAVDELWSFLGQVLDAFAPPECRNDFRHSGYAATATYQTP